MLDSFGLLFPVESIGLSKKSGKSAQNGWQREVKGRKRFAPTRRRLILLFKEIARSSEEVTSTDEVEGLNINQNELTAIRDKRKELNAIQADLDDLMGRLNVFIGESVGLTDGKL